MRVHRLGKRCSGIADIAVDQMADSLNRIRTLPRELDLILLFHTAEKAPQTSGSPTRQSARDRSALNAAAVRIRGNIVLFLYGMLEIMDVASISYRSWPPPGLAGANPTELDGDIVASSLSDLLPNGFPLPLPLDQRFDATSEEARRR